MSQSLVGQVLHWQGRLPSNSHYVDNSFCLVLEESEDTLVAVHLRTEEVHFHGYRGTLAPLSEQIGERFVLRKATRCDQDGQPRAVGIVREGEDELTYEVWDGQPAYWGWDYG